MKIYQYDHCPYCVRVNMVAHYKEISYESVYPLNDDEQTCISLIGIKVVPIMEVDGRVSAESLEIVRQLDEMGSSEKVIADGGFAEPVLDIFNEMRYAINCLLFPRDLMLNLPEFKTASAQDYFRKNKERMIGLTFEEALEQTPELCASVESGLRHLPHLVKDQTEVGRISWDDVMIFPTLRNLSMVKGLRFPKALRHYIDQVADATSVDLYFDRAV